jgi:hypothetical protein
MHTERGDAADRTVGEVDLTRWRSRAGRSVASAWTALGKRFGAMPILLLTLAVGLGVAVLATWIASEVYDAVREADDVAVLDRPVLDWALTLRSPTASRWGSWSASRSSAVRGRHWCSSSPRAVVRCS